MKHFTFYQQLDFMDCGPTCLRMVAKHYGKHYNAETLRRKSGLNREGVSLLGISEAAEAVGFRTRGVKLNAGELLEEALLPCILHWNQNHFVVLPPQKISLKGRNSSNMITVADPAAGMVTYTVKEFIRCWISTHEDEDDLGIALLLEPSPLFFEAEEDTPKKVSWKKVFGYLAPYKRLAVQLFVGFLLGSLLQLIFPFLTQSIVDVGINGRNLSYIHLILIAQLMLVFGRTIIEFIRSRILLYVSSRVNISILSDFWIKLTRLPMSYFDSRMTGDIMQRIGDQHRIEQFLTGNTLSILFSMLNLLVFSIVLLIYDWRVFAIFTTGSVLYFYWVTLFLKYRRDLDFKRFNVAARENGAMLQLVTGMQEIKLNNSEQYRRWEWEDFQVKTFKISFKSLSLVQYQQIGAFFINEGKNIFITFFVAQAVINGQLSLGAMLAIQYIIGQLSSPIEQLIQFVQLAQDAKMSLERLNEIHELEDEEPQDKELIKEMPDNRSITLRDFSFTYAGAGNEPVLDGLDLTIEEGKVTAIVGMSGSGKTTLLKILLKFYENFDGVVKVDDVDIRNISPHYWRSRCGSVMQDGYIFNDTIARNIAASDMVPDEARIRHAARIANIMPFVNSLPAGFNTKIGGEGHGLSQGQKQRILIARAVYKDPEFLFFDEATNALDANNEKTIMENLQAFFQGKTVVVVAHRLSTVKSADKIVVLNEGVIVEQGNHEMLTQKKGYYYNLVKNQLELGA